MGCLLFCGAGIDRREQDGQTGLFKDPLNPLKGNNPIKKDRNDTFSMLVFQTFALVPPGSGIAGI